MRYRHTKHIIHALAHGGRRGNGVWKEENDSSLSCYVGQPSFQYDPSQLMAIPLLCVRISHMHLVSFIHDFCILGLML